MSKKKKIILGVVGVVLVLLVVMGLRGRKDKDVARVTTAKVEKIDLVSKVTANGKIQARRKVDLSALVMGQIVNLAVKEGDKVDRGQLLLQIDRAQLAAQTAGRESALGAMRSRPGGREGDRRTGAARLPAGQAELGRQDPFRGGVPEGPVAARHGGGEPLRGAAAACRRPART